jgi:hypothetical protein
VEIMPEKKNCEESVSVYPRRNKSVGKPRHRWLGDVENDLKKMGVRGWRKTLGIQMSRIIIHYEYYLGRN